MTARPGLDDLLSLLPAGDVFVIWELYRLGRNLKHFVMLMMESEVDLINSNDPIDTTTPQGGLIFNIFRLAGGV